jgi:hypothetical protein
MNVRKPSIAFCTTNYGPIESSIYQNHLAAVSNASRTFDVKFIGTTDKMYTHTASNTLANNALEQAIDYIFWTENDMLLPFDCITKLYDVLKHTKKLIASGIYFLRGNGTRPCLFNRIPGEKYKYTPVLMFPEKSVFTIDCPGMGCVLMHTDVFRALETPFFDLKENTYGQDMYFYSKVKDSKIDVLCDSNITCGHMGSRQIYTIEDYRKFISETKTIIPEGGMIITNPQNYVDYGGK